MAAKASDEDLFHSGLLNALLERTLRTLQDVDIELAAQRVADLRAKHHLQDDVLVEHLIWRKARQAGMVGAATSAAALIPGLGGVAAFTVGAAADVGATLRLQSELVMEIAAARGKRLQPDQARNALLVVAGLNVGAERLVNQASRRLATRLSERFAGRALVKAVPFIGVAISAAANLLMTYLIGKRADAYFRLGEAHVGDWSESLRALTGLDERRLSAELGAILSETGRLVRSRMQQLGARTEEGLLRLRESAARPIEQRLRLPKASIHHGDLEKQEKGEKRSMLDKLKQRLRIGLPTQEAPQETAAMEPQPPSIVDVTDADFESVVVQSSLPAVVDFWAEWCQPCQVMSAYVEFLARDYAGRLLVTALDTDENPQTPARYNVMGLPTLLLMRNGEEVDRIVGMASYGEIKARVEALLGRA
ncbi:MAG: thioredoxin domain-containing protein [Caldilineaceae bacterium]|nr:thioredoxin domain-containing protein [Caldilineaceae bacterium]